MKLHRGFTLVELLVVMVIILILASILYPVFSSARNKTRQVKCVSQLRQIGMGIQMYTTDYDDFLPIGAYNTPQLPPGFIYPPHGSTAAPSAPGVPGQQDQRVDWHDELLYTGNLKSYDILVCPSAQSTDYRYSYGVNRHIMWWMGSLRTDLIDRPTNTVMVTEKSGTDWVAWQPSEKRNNPYYLPLEVRHQNQLNVLFCDGHVGHVGFGELIEGGSVLWTP